MKKFLFSLLIALSCATGMAQVIIPAPVLDKTVLKGSCDGLFIDFIIHPGINAGDMVFADASVGAASYQWSFGDGSASEKTINPQHTFMHNGVFDVCLKATSPNGCVDSACKAVTVSNMSIENISSEILLSVSPNPTSGVINVDVSNMNVKNSAIKVYSIIGKELEHLDVNEVSQDLYQIDLSREVDGFYFVRVQTPKEVFTWRVALSR